MKVIKLVASITLLLLSQLVSANVSLNSLFADHMVVQQKTKIPVWGWADPMEKVLVKASWGAEAETIAKADGSWSLKLKTPKAGGPFKIVISGKNRIVLEDVLAGEVWLCSGQSNMDFSMSKFTSDSREAKYQPLVEYIREEVKTANDPWLRHIEVAHTTSLNGKKNNFEGNWRSATAGHVGKITATGYFFAKELRKQLNVPIGLVECALGGTRIQPWLSEEAYAEDEEMKAFFDENRAEAKILTAEMSKEGYLDTVYQNKLKAWKANKKNLRKPWPSENPESDKQMPATLYNGMLLSIIPFAIKGVLWYQGESNSHYLENEYEKYFTKLINSWRADWKQADLPFYWTQLAAYHVPDERSDMGWASINDQLRRTLKLPNTGMAVLYDIGEAKDVHPHNKMDTGKRLALWALSNDYGVKVPAVSGPLYKSSKITDGKIEIKFNQVGSGLMVGEKKLSNPTVAVDESLKFFEIAGEDDIWKSADAKIISSNRIEVSSPEVEKPISVRYGWSSNPTGANLYNKEGLPASVFTSENN
ncbi:sialate O-acetylesterase [Ancylomarina sp. 16SWW S1-10-2]|uniref:sialate O-acetylesterase n=1 Tax=Ancylomarina sp. 16SWW S1-10-2 TaxID=2499681 RepID=UPI0012AE9EAF|nr:sialate O-acetylesterase [Ancylomarina sp. 16SWW S1-10-2]MRT93815.1 9-O-acetylesterase [Ancylomarina sp. 16SWW S1-10-2]